MANPKELDPSSSPSAFYGGELRRVREAAGLSQDRLGERIFCSGAYIGQLEAAIRKPQLDLSERMDEVLGTDGHLARLCKLARKSRHADYFADAAELLAMAQTICEYSPELVPGLLQTEGYARAVVRAATPLASQAKVDERVAARRERARLLLDDPTTPLYWAILPETVLRIPVGGASVMREQLAHIADLMRANRILVQVIPNSVGARAIMGEMTSLMTFADAPPAVYAEGTHTGQLIDEAALVAKYQRSYDLLRAVALSPEASLALIEAVTKEYDTDDNNA